jgi:hypothetical protein
MNVSIRIDDPADGSSSRGLGQAVVGRNSWQVTLDGIGSLYEFTAHPTVHTLSFAAIGLGGGTALTIKGSGFSSTASANAVSLGGVPCIVTEASATLLVCTPGAAGSQTTPYSAPATGPAWGSTGGPAAYKGRMWPGGRGLLQRVWSGYSNWNLWTSPPLPAPSFTTINTDAGFGYYFNDAYNYMEVCNAEATCVCTPLSPVFL